MKYHLLDGNGSLGNGSLVRGTIVHSLVWPEPIVSIIAKPKICILLENCFAKQNSFVRQTQRALKNSVKCL